MTKTPAPELLEICPFCGERITRTSFTDNIGTRHFSLCCETPLEILDNWDVYAGLPESLQKVAIDKIKARWAAMTKKSHENAQEFRKGIDKWNKSHPHLFKGTTTHVAPMHD